MKSNRENELFCAVAEAKANYKAARAEYRKANAKLLQYRKKKRDRQDAQRHEELKKTLDPPTTHQWREIWWLISEGVMDGRWTMANPPWSKARPVKGADWKTFVAAEAQIERGETPPNPFALRVDLTVLGVWPVPRSRFGRILHPCCAPSSAFGWEEVRGSGNAVDCHWRAWAERRPYNYDGTEYIACQKN